MATDANSYPGARFHFDPLYDRSHVRTIGDLRMWIGRNIIEDASPIGSSFKSLLRCESLNMSIRSRLIRSFPFLRGKAYSRTAVRAVEAVEREIDPIQKMAAEFGVNILNHPLLSNTFETIASFGIFRLAEDEFKTILERTNASGIPERDTLEAFVKGMEIDKNVSLRHQRIRFTLENEALANLLENPTLQADDKRLIAALKSAREEITDEEILAKMDQTIGVVEARSNQA